MLWPGTKAEMTKSTRTFSRAAGICLAIVLGAAGCSGGEFRAEEVRTKAAVQKDIDQVKGNVSIPEAAKPRIIAGLEEEMKHAKG